MRREIFSNSERGTSIVEFAIAATVFFTVTFGIMECGRMLWSHNTLATATRLGARYAVTHVKVDPANPPENVADGTVEDATTAIADVKNVVVYGMNKNGTPKTSGPVINGLDASDVVVTFTSDYGTAMGVGAATVHIDSNGGTAGSGFEFDLIMPLPGFGSSVQLPDYKATLTGEGLGYVPD